MAEDDLLGGRCPRYGLVRGRSPLIMPSFGILALVAVVGAVIWKLLQSGERDAIFNVKVEGPGEEGVVVSGEVPGYGHGDVREFVAGLELPEGARLWGEQDGASVRIRFSDEVPERLQQRLRNMFLLGGG